MSNEILGVLADVRDLSLQSPRSLALSKIRVA